jgi:hypothetical protein
MNQSKDPWNTVRELAATLPGVEESRSRETPTLKVGVKLFARLHEDGESVVVRIDKRHRTALLRENPVAFHVTDHYSGFPYLLVRVHKVSVEELRGLLEDAWRLVAPPELVEAYDLSSAE